MEKKYTLIGDFFYLSKKKKVIPFIKNIDKNKDLK